MEAGGLSHVVVVQDGQRRLVQRTGFVKESALQSLVLGSPELLGPLGADLRFIPIGREVTLGAGRLDLLFLDSEGILTLVETKLRANNESRREVIGQILEYAAFASEWSRESVELGAAAFFSSPHAPSDLAGLTLEGAISVRMEWGSDEVDERTAKIEALLAKLEASMKDGRLRIVCGVDERIENLERLVRYLSLHSDLQVVLLQVNQFPVNASFSVLVPTLHGDIDSSPGRATVTSTTRLTLNSLVESFPDGPEREVVAKIIQAATALGASFEPGPSGTSIRTRTPSQQQPVTIAWIYAPGKVPWMKTREITFGHGLDYDKTNPVLRAALERYYNRLIDAGIGSDASSKGVHARWVTPMAAATHLDKLLELMTSVVTELSDLPPETPPPALVN